MRPVPSIPLLPHLSVVYKFNLLASCDETDLAKLDSQKEDNNKEQKQQQAAAQRRKVMAEMAALQKKFLQSNRQVLSEIDTGGNIDE